MHVQTDSHELARRCAQARTFTELAAIAVHELHQFPGSMHIVCGPITTGGLGSFEANFLRFNEVINDLLAKGYPVFSQIPYEDAIIRLRDEWVAADPRRAGTYCMPILLEFYASLFDSNKIGHAWFIRGWESSHGARWERERLSTIGVKIIDL